MNEILLYFSLKYNGDWAKIYSAINSKEPFLKEKLEELKKNLRSSYITILDDLYPKHLQHITNPPFVLYYRGNIDLIKQKDIATVVGSRHPTEYGLKCTRNIVSELAEHHFIICSGLALGVDAEAHRTALNKNTPNIGVVPNGIDQTYPKTNADLYQKIVDDGGLIISEYPDGVEPTRDKYNMRNRLLAGFGNFVVVSEAFEKSGTLLTVKHAMYFGKDVYVFPTNADNEHINNKLIKEGAILVENLDDLMLEFKKF